MDLTPLDNFQFTTDLTGFTGMTLNYSTSSELLGYTVHVYQVPLYFYIVIAIPFLLLGKRILKEFIARWRSPQ